MQLGYTTYRSNFRGVGQTGGEHDNGIGEQDDLLALIDHMRAQPGQADMPIVLAGFSFGTFVLSHVAKRMLEAGRKIERMVFVDTAASRWDVAPVPESTLVIHGELDETVPIQSVYDWARPQELPVVVIPGGEHLLLPPQAAHPEARHRRCMALSLPSSIGWRKVVEGLGARIAC